MRILVAPLEYFVLGEKTFFQEKREPNTFELKVKSAHNFKENDFIVLGNIGNETTEIKQIDSVSSDLKTIHLKEETNFTHRNGEPIQSIMFNKRKFYRSESKDGNYIHLSTEGSPVNIEVDIPEGTRFEDSTGSSSHYYKSTYWNDFTQTETSLSDAISSQANQNNKYTTIFKIRREAGLLNNYYIQSDEIEGYRLEAESQIDGIISSVYSLPLSSPSKILQHIATLLAAGHLLSKEYGMEADIEISKSGQRKIERAEELLEKIVQGELLLIGEEGNIISRRSSFTASGSNVYSDDRPDKGVLFNLEPEHFKLTDPNEPLTPSDRK